MVDNDDITAPGPSNANPDQEDIRKKMLRDKVARSRAKKTAEQKEMDKLKNSEFQANKRAKRSEEQRQQDRLKNAQSQAKTRAKKAKENVEDYRKEMRKQKSQQRKPSQTKVGVKDGLRSHEILDGIFIVPLLETSPAMA